MDKKEIILTVAKDILIAYKVMPEEKDRAAAEKVVASLGGLLDQMTKEVEKVYANIKG